MSGTHGGSDDGGVGSPVGNGLVGLLTDSARTAGLTGWLASRFEAVPVVWRRRLGGGTVAGVGLLLIGVPVVHAVQHSVSVEGVLGDLLPLGFGVLLLLAGAWLRWGADDDMAPVVAAFWVVSSLLVSGAVSLYVLGLHAAHGHVVESPSFLVFDIAATGAVAGLLISRYDVRARTRHRRLSEQERQFRAVFEGTLDALVITDDRGRYVAANPAAADLFGLPRSELVGRRIEEFAPEGTDVEAQWTAFLEEGGQRGEFELVRADGETRTVAYAATSNVLPGRHLSALRDVTERTEHQRELDAERARIEFLNRLLRHNVLNGMNLVLAKLDALAAAVPEERRGDVDVARHRSEEIVDLVQTARRLSTDVAGGTAERRVDLTDVLSDAVADLRESYPEATVEFTPPTADPQVLADDMLGTVFDHLLTNAAEHNDPASLRVTVGVECDAETVTVSVADDGVGIPADRREQLFDDGFGHDRDWGGFGLSIVDVLVDRYGGHVRAAANEPSGVVFHVELPRADA
ncbi:ATP-binding protein [Haloplanus halophilus]|uniref:ATP-binding protein n=1 Tax=Haloplanus halophilus TaxID=2949993 RepID=UPI00203CB13A|nr:ATP-binding protein [Haloplanus sp. GDY1]